MLFTNIRIAIAIISSLIILYLQLTVYQFNSLLFGGLVSVLLIYEYVLFISDRKFNDKLEKLRQQIALDLHDDVGANLAALAMQTELFAIAHPDSDVKKLEKLQAMARLSMVRMRDIVWNMKPQGKTWGQLVERLQDHANQSLDLNNVSVVLKLSGINRDDHLSAEICKHFYLIGKEAITNISKHSNADQVDIWFQKRMNKFEMTIKDNGSNQLKQEPFNSGIGLKNMNERAKDLGAKLRFISNKGFRVMLQITL